MEHAPSLILAATFAFGVLGLLWQNRGANARHERLEAKIDARRTELSTKIEQRTDSLRTEMNEELRQVRHDITAQTAVISDLAQRVSRLEGAILGPAAPPDIDTGSHEQAAPAPGGGTARASTGSATDPQQAANPA
ncbi:hypothetical protein [Candidatus Poriferisodalis sp.]|uniref:hypothetical protein n=1 Tax=Candidatus Poriferisodalis sp. TaxID=3101277 RepID=UPI003B02DE03